MGYAISEYQNAAEIYERLDRLMAERVETDLDAFKEVAEALA